MPVQWTEELATGVARIDAQHREIYRLVASLHEVMRQGRLDEVHATVDCLRSYATSHFADEEWEMEAAGYPWLAAHRAIHRNFAEALAGFRARLEGEGATLSLVVELSQWLSDWLRDHVRRVDGDMAKFLRVHRHERQPGQALAEPSYAWRHRP